VVGSLLTSTPTKSMRSDYETIVNFYSTQENKKIITGYYAVVRRDLTEDRTKKDHLYTISG